MNKSCKRFSQGFLLSPSSPHPTTTCGGPSGDTGSVGAVHRGAAAELLPRSQRRGWADASSLWCHRAVFARRVLAMPGCICSGGPRGKPAQKCHSVMLHLGCAQRQWQDRTTQCFLEANTPLPSPIIPAGCWAGGTNASGTGQPPSPALPSHTSLPTIIAKAH